MRSPVVIKVEIYHAPSASSASCGCGCGHHDQHGQGPGANLELEARALAMTLESYFPGRVKVDYINVLRDPRGANLPQTALLASLAYPTPLVYINGQGRFAGSLPVERIREEVQRILANA
jgi:hypothetical protein